MRRCDVSRDAAAAFLEMRARTPLVRVSALGAYRPVNACDQLGFAEGAKFARPLVRTSSGGSSPRPRRLCALWRARALYVC